MKKIIVSTTFLSLLILASCGKSEICDCAETGLSMMKEAKEAGMDPVKMEAIQAKYKADMEKCEKLDEGKTDAEKKAMQEEMKKCDSFKELEEMSEAMMR